MRIPRQQRPTPWFNRRDQYRLLAMFGLLCLVMAAAMLAARPQSWYWLLPPADESSTTGEVSGKVALKELDFRVMNDPRPPLPPGVFRAVAASGQAATEESNHREAGSGPTSADDSTDVAIPADQLDGIEDNTIGVRSAEQDAYLTMLDKVRRLPQTVLDDHAADDVAFTVIMLQPDDYRGRLVSVTGWLHRLVEFPVITNDRGINTLYEGWMFTGDSGNNPWRFVSSAIPPGVALGEDINPVKIRVVGYFFKRMGYASQGGQHVAPALLAHTFEVLPVPVDVTPQMQSQLYKWMFGVVAATIIGLAALMWWFARSDRKYAGSRVHHLAASHPDLDASDLEALRELDTGNEAT